MTDPLQAFCRVCRGVLDLYYADPEDPTTAEWCHAGGVKLDHEPEVVYTDEDHGLSPVTKCDFCTGGSLEWWRYPCAPFAMPGSKYGSADDWAACTECHELIEKDYWYKVANRMLDYEFPDGIAEVWLRRETRKAILDLHRRFREHRTGPAVKA